MVHTTLFYLHLHLHCKSSLNKYVYNFNEGKLLRFDKMLVNDFEIVLIGVTFLLKVGI